MTFNKRITLLKLVTKNGGKGFEITAQRTVWAEVRDIGVTTKYTAAAAGREATLQTICHRKEYEAESYTHAEYSGKRYRIESTGAADNERHIRLIFAKGG